MSSSAKALGFDGHYMSSRTCKLAKSQEKLCASLLVTRDVICHNVCAFSAWDECIYANQRFPCSDELLYVGVCVGLLTGDTDGSCVYAVLLLVFGLIASMPTRFLMLYTIFSGVFLLFGGALLIAVMLALAPSYRSASWVFGAFKSGDAEAVGISHWGCVTTRSAYYLPGSLRVPCHQSWPATCVNECSAVALP